MAYNYAWSFLLAYNKLAAKETDISKVGLTHFWQFGLLYTLILKGDIKKALL